MDTVVKSTSVWYSVQGWSWGLSRTVCGTCSKYHFCVSGEIVARTPPEFGTFAFLSYAITFPCMSKSSWFLRVDKYVAYRLKRHPSQQEQLQERKCPTFWFQEKRKRKHARHPRWLEGPCFRPHLKINNQSPWSDFPLWFQRTSWYLDEEFHQASSPRCKHWHRAKRAIELCRWFFYPLFLVEKSFHNFTYLLWTFSKLDVL